MIMFFFCKQKTAYEMRISDWSSDVCSSDLSASATSGSGYGATSFSTPTAIRSTPTSCAAAFLAATARRAGRSRAGYPRGTEESDMTDTSDPRVCPTPDLDNGREPKHPKHPKRDPRCRSEEHTSELQSLMRISYAV